MINLLFTQKIEQAQLFEETGLTAKALEFFNVYSGKEMLYTYLNGDKVYLIVTFFLCEDFEGTIKPAKNEVL